MDVMTASYFMARHLKPSVDYFMVQTSNSKLPNFKIDYDWVAVRPPWRIVDLYKKGEMTWPQYSENYYRNILLPQPTTIRTEWQQEILEMAGNRTIVLLCWCQADDRCHRSLLYKYLEEHHPWT